MEEQLTRDKFTINYFWKLCDKFFPNIVTLIVSIILARLLSPSDFGIVAIANVFIIFADILVQSGFCESLIQKREASQTDYATATTISMIIAAILYIAVFFASPFIERFYEMESLSKILRVLAIVVFLNGFSAVMEAYVIRNFRFKLMFFARAISAVISAVAGITAAYLGLGPWALVVQKLSQQVVFMVILIIILRWRLLPKLDKKSAKELLRYGGNVLGGAMIAFVSDNVYSVAIGKKYTSADLGYLNKAEQLPNASVTATSSSLATVTLSTIAKMQDDKQAVNSAYRKIMKLLAYIVFPLVVGMFVVADEFICVLYTDKFRMCVPIMRGLLLFYFTVPFLLSAGAVVRGMGNSKIYILSELLKMVITLTLVLSLTLATTIDLVWFAWIKGFVSVFMCAWTLIFTKKYFDYGPIKHLQDILPSVLLTALMGGTTYLIGLPLSSLPPIAVLAIRVVFGIAIYIVMSIIATKFFKFNEFNTALSIFKSLLTNLKKIFRRTKAVSAESAGGEENKEPPTNGNEESETDMPSEEQPLSDCKEGDNTAEEEKTDIQ